MPGSRARIKPPGKTTAERDAKALGMIESLLDGLAHNALRCVTCQKPIPINDINPSVIQAIRLRYDRLRPTLTSVEQKTADPFANMNRDQVLSKLRLLLKNSELARELGVMPIPEPAEQGPVPAPEAHQEALESSGKPSPIH